MNDDLISREAVLSLAKEIVVPQEGGDYRHRCIDPQDVRELPSVIRLGEWITKNRETGEWVAYEYPDKENCFYLQCSVCGKPAIWANGVSNFPPRFCPSCGAEMKNHKDRISNF